MTHVVLGMAAWDLILLAVGFFLLFGLGFAGLGPPDVRLIPLAFLTGWTLMGLFFSLAVIAGFDPSVPHVLIAAIGLCGACVVARRFTSREALLAPSRLRVAVSAWARGRVTKLGPFRSIFVAGLVLLGVLFLAVVLATVNLGLPYLLIAVAVAAVAACVPFRARIRRAGIVRVSAALLTLVAGALMALVAFSAVLSAVQGTWPSERDSFTFWGPRAEVIYFFHGLDTGIGGWGSLAHPEYPPLLAVVYAACFHFCGGFHPSVIPLQNTLLIIAFVGGMLALLDRVVPRWVSFPFFALLAVSSGVLSRVPSLMADPALSYLVAAAALTCLLWLSTRRNSWLPLCVLFLGAAAQTKLDGLGDALVIITAVLAAAFIRDGRAALPGLVMIIGPALIVPWRLWLKAHDLPVSSPDYRAGILLHPIALGRRLPLLADAAHYVTHQLFSTSHWLIIVPLALASIAIAARRATATAAAAAAWLALAFAGMAAVYWTSTMEIHLYLVESGDRITAKLVIAAATVAPLLLGLAVARPTAHPALASHPGHEQERATGTG